VPVPVTVFALAVPIEGVTVAVMDSAPALVGANWLTVMRLQLAAEAKF
jgi:hypothetical protein